MLETRSDMIWRRDIVAFQSADECRAQDFRQIRVLAERLPEARPEGLAANVQDGRETPQDSGGARLTGCDLGPALHQFGIPGRGHTDLLRKERRALHVVRAVNGINAVKDGNLQTRSL